MALESWTKVGSHQASGAHFALNSLGISIELPWCSCILRPHTLVAARSQPGTPCKHYVDCHTTARNGLCPSFTFLPYTLLSSQPPSNMLPHSMLQNCSPFLGSQPFSSDSFPHKQPVSQQQWQHVPKLCSHNPLAYLSISSERSNIAQLGADWSASLLRSVPE